MLKTMQLFVATRSTWNRESESVILHLLFNGLYMTFNSHARVACIACIITLLIFSNRLYASTVVGVYLPGNGWQPGEFEELNANLNRHVAIQNVYSAFTHTWDQLYWQSTLIHEAGSTPMISWMPIDLSNPEANLLPEIIDGHWDFYLDSWANSLVSFVEQYSSEEQPYLLLRFGHEFNGNWYPYANHPDLYKSSWRYIYDRFETAGANQYIQWIWSVNNFSSDDYNDVTQYYPGDDIVDWTSIDGYNWGSNYIWSDWMDFTSTFGPAYNTLIDNYPDKPVIIAEMSSAEPFDTPDAQWGQFGDDSDALESKDVWMKVALQQIESDFTAVRAVVLFNENKELSWSLNEIESTGLSGFNDSLSSSHFVGSMDDLYLSDEAEPVPDNINPGRGKNKQNKGKKKYQEAREQQNSEILLSDGQQTTDLTGDSLSPPQIDQKTISETKPVAKRAKQLAPQANTRAKSVELPARVLENTKKMRAGLRNMPQQALDALKIIKLEVVNY